MFIKLLFFLFKKFQYFGIILRNVASFSYKQIVVSTYFRIRHFSYNQRLRTKLYKINKIIFSLSNKRKIELARCLIGRSPLGIELARCFILKRTTAFGLLPKFLTLDYPILWAGIAWRLLREICVSSRRQQLLPPRGSKFRVVMARCQKR